MIKTIYCISPNHIKIIEDIDGLITKIDINKIQPYLQDCTTNTMPQKFIIAVKDKNNHLIALDGNKLCFTARLLHKKVKCMILSTESDKKALDEKLYTSPLIWKNPLCQVISIYSNRQDFLNVAATGQQISKPTTQHISIILTNSRCDLSL